jgi:MSHA type pilus biogenesis protein MshL
MVRRNNMKREALPIFLIGLLLTAGCATPVKREQIKLSSQPVKAPPPSPQEEGLRELIVPQREEPREVPERLYSFSARDADIQDVLLTFSKESDLNLVIDPDLSGKVTVDLKRVTLKEALDTILSPLGWTYRMEERFVRIFKLQMETRLFTLNYIATRRSGKREIYASTGGGMQAGVTVGQQAVISSSGSRTGYSDLVSVDEMDLWKEIRRGLETIVFGSAVESEEGDSSKGENKNWTHMDERGKKLIINKLTGVIWVKDYPANLNKVASFLELTEGSSQRQVTIQAKIMEVILSEEHREGINWRVLQSLPRSTNLAWGLTNRAGTSGFPGGPGGFLVEDTGGSSINTPGTFKIKPFGGIFAIGPGGTDILLSDIIEAISEQGDVKILSSPTISTLNNQKAIIRVANQDVFFITGAVATQTTVTQTIQPVTIDVGIILDVTPQIADDGTIIMNIHPSITEKTGEKASPDGRTTFPLLSVRETDTTVRVHDGQTIIIAGLMQERKDETQVGIPGLKSFPLLGGLFRHKTETKRNTELVIMITPTLQVGKKAADLTDK